MTTSFMREVNRLPPLRVSHRTASKYTQIRQRLYECARGVAPETRLPTLRELGMVFDVTPPTVWRAVKALVAEGVLYTREKSGIFVSRSPGGRETRRETAGLDVDERTLTLAAEAVLPHQQRFWRETQEAFHRTHRLIHLRLGDSAVSRSGQAPACDLMAEFLPRTGSPSVPETAMLDLETLMGAEVTRPFLNHVFPARARRFVPFQLTVPCLFINLRWTEENRLKRPEFSGFPDQCAYIDACLDRLSKRPMVPAVCLNTQQPLLWLGRRALEIVDLARGAASQGAEAVLERLVRDTETVLRNWRKVNIGSFAHGFLEGRTGFYFGFSYEIEVVEAGRPDFPWQVIPALAVDNRTPVLPQCLAVDAQTPYPIECIRFIEHVVSPAGQQRLADCTQVPLDARRLWAAAGPARSEFGPEWKALPERMALIYPADDTCDYIYNNIMTDDLYGCVDGSVSARDAIESMIRHARTYLLHRQSLPPAAVAGAEKRASQRLFTNR